MYITRTIGQVIVEASKTFKVIMITGPRQVGKTTVLQHIEQDKRSYITMDDLNIRMAAISDPATFITRLKLPVLIDEVQYTPQLFSYIKLIVDRSNTTGLFWLTGSQQFDMMKNVTESLAGRVAILNLQGISLAEEEGRAQTSPFLPSVEAILLREQIARPINIDEIYHKIWRGGYPDVLQTMAQLGNGFMNHM